MDFYGLARKELQALCKKNKIPANMTNVAMADALTALENVEGLDEFLNSSNSDLSNPAVETLIGSPDIPRTACRTSTRRKPIKEESESTQPLARTRRGTRGRSAEEVDQENKDVNVLVTPAAPGGRRRAPAASTRRNIEAQMKEDEEDERNEAPGRSAVPSSRGRAPGASARRKLDVQKEENSVQRVYSTRRSVRLLEKSMANLSMMENGNAEPVKMGDLSEEMANSSERSEVSVEVEKNIHGSEAASELDSQKTDVSEVLEVGVGDKDQTDDGDEANVSKSEQADVLKSEDAVGSEISDSLAGAEVPEAVDSAPYEGSDKLDIISSEKLEKDIDVEDETVEKGQDDVSVSLQDTRSDLSTGIKDEHAVCSFHVQDLASRDSDINVEVGEDLGGHDSESEYTTEGESDEHEVTDANSSESEENNSDDDSETEEKESDAPVLPENQMIGFEKLENKMEVDIQRSKEELDELVTKADASDFDGVATFNDDSGSKILVAEQSEGGEDLGGHDSESEYTTEGESDEHEVTDANSSESEENNSDDDSETEEKESDAPVLPENQMIGLEKLENKMEVDIQRSKEELDELVTKTDASDFDGDATFNDDSGSKILAAEQSEGEVSVNSAEKESLNDDHVMVPCPVENPGPKMEGCNDEELVGDCMTETECPPSVKKTSPSISDSEVTGLIPSQPFAVDQISGQFPRPTQLTPKKSSAQKQSILNITDVSDDDEEDLDNGNGKVELKEEMTRQDENLVNGDSMLKTYTGMSLRQLKKELKEMQITHNSKNNQDKSFTEELAGKKRIALQQLPENYMEVNESEKVQ